MFTGIVKGIGKVLSLEKNESILRYAIQCPESFLDGIETGASISIDGVCQTVVDFQKDTLWLEAIGETLFRTTLKQLQEGRFVNLERSARIGDEIGGHLLSGHIFGTASISSIQKNVYTVTCAVEWMKYLFSKGFIAIDGISLTLVDVDLAGTFTVHLIPETLKRTTLGLKKSGESVNLEFDALTQAAVETVERSLKAR